MHKIGLTGGICSGKTFVLKVLEENGCYALRADEIAKKIIFSANSEILKEIVAVFGESIYNEESGIKKDEFARILFEDAEKRKFINDIVHPLVRKERNQIIADLTEAKVYDFFIYESALLVESGNHKDFERIIVVYTTPEEQLRRLINRDNISNEEAEKRIKAQFPLSEKLKVAHHVIDTTGSFEKAKANTLETFYLLKKDFNLL